MSGAEQRIEGAMREGRFAARPLAFVARDGDLFLKVPRLAGGPLVAWRSAEVIAAATEEHALLDLLAAADPDVLRPTDRVAGCLAFPWLEGPDLLVVLRGGDSDQQRSAIEAAVDLLGRLHAKLDLAAQGAIDYASDPWLTGATSFADRLEGMELGPVVRGIELRNFRFDAVAGRWRFFDPHRCGIGARAEDLARFVVSLLMVRWGAFDGFRAWEAFDLDALLERYARAAGRPLRDADFATAFDYNLAMRRHHAERAVAVAPLWLRPAYRIYLDRHFAALDAWRVRNVRL